MKAVSYITANCEGFKEVQLIPLWHTKQMKYYLPGPHKAINILNYMFYKIQMLTVRVSQ